MVRIPIVNEQDEIIAYKERAEVQETDIYRVAALWITDPEGHILLARRAFTKKNDPGKWGPAVAGTVEEGETYEQNIIKEAEEELGLSDTHPVFFRKSRKHGKHNYFGAWYRLVIPRDTPLKMQESEVAEVKWWAREELGRAVDEQPDEFLASVRQWQDF